MRDRVDSGILHEIVRLIDAKSKVPDRVILKGKKFQITYLEDHKQRLEEAIRRRDRDRLNMLYGQLASKVKYQHIRGATVKSKARPIVVKAGKSASTPKAKIVKSAVAPPKMGEKRTTTKVTAPKSSRPPTTARR